MHALTCGSSCTSHVLCTLPLCNPPHLLHDVYVATREPVLASDASMTAQAMPVLHWRKLADSCTDKELEPWTC